MPNRSLRSLPLALLAAAALLPGCAKREEAAVPDITPEEQAYYASYKFIPAALKNDLAAGKIDQAEYDRQVAALPLFFERKTPTELPAGLEWENGLDLPEFADPKAKRGGTFYTRMQDFPRTLRHIGPDSNSGFRPYILDDIAISLAHRHPNVTGIGPKGFHHFPGLAREWAIDPETRTVFVRLHEDARWSDGQPVTTADFEFMFFFYSTSYIRAPWYNNYYGTTFSRFTRYDDRTFAVQVAERRPDFAFRALSLTGVPRHFYLEVGDDFAERYQWRVVPTTGAYTIREQDIDKGRSITLTRVPNWWASDKPFWRGRFNPDRIRLSVIRDTPKAFEAFKKGELDAFGLTLAEYWYDKLPDSDPDVAAGYIHKFKFFNDIPRPTYGLWMNTSRPLLDNRDIRVGINHATNWDLVIEKFFRGDAIRMQTTSDGYGEFTHPTLRSRPFSVDEALAAFARAGFTRRGDDGILVNDRGERLSFTLTTGYEALRDILTILREEARKAGLEFRLEVLDGTAAWKKVQEKQHDIMFSAFAVSAEMYPRYWETYHSANAYKNAFLPDGSPNPAREIHTQTNNLEVIAIPELDRLIDAYDRSESAEEMKKMAFRMEEILHEHASFVPGFINPFYRLGNWRWLGHPAAFNVKLSRSFDEYYLFWIDEDLRRETNEARRTGRTYPPRIEVFDQFRTR